MIVSAIITDAKTLTKIALKSKAFWGYSNELIKSWKNDLMVTSAMITNCTVFNFLVDEEIVGFYVLNPPKNNSVELEMLFILPNFIGKGFGNELLQHSFKKALAMNTKFMTLLSDPNAVPFYKSKGFYEIDRKESSIVGRFLPILQKDLEQ